MYLNVYLLKNKPSGTHEIYREHSHDPTGGALKKGLITKNRISNGGVGLNRAFTVSLH